MKIITIPDPRLRQRSKKLKISEIKTDKIQRFIFNLSKIMQKNDGLGIAAPQAAKNIRIIIINTEDGPTPFINPLILWRSFRQEIAEEGCLSVPETYGLVRRSKTALVTYLDKTGKRKRLKAKGLLARVLQHEIDHLNGILFIDKMAKRTK